MPGMPDTVLFIGTSKGLFTARSADGRSWQCSGPTFEMRGVYGLGIGADGRVFAGAASSHWGPSLSYSDDLGETWHEPAPARDGAAGGPIAFGPDDGASVERVWQVVASPTEPGVVWAGVEPSALFRSTDNGEHFDLVRGLWDHPHRPHWEAGFGGQAIHSIEPHPTDPDRILVAMSTGGVYRSADGGNSWTASNTGIKAYFLPDPYPEYGQCVHKISRASSRPDTVYAQNHHGVYRSDDDGQTWTSIADGLPADFGFPIVAHPTRPDTVWTFPLVADGDRKPPDATMRVFRSDDAGRSWSGSADGFPPPPVYTVVLRDAMCTDPAGFEHPDRPAGLYLGTRDGCVYASADAGESFVPVATHLPDVLNVKAVTV